MFDFMDHIVLALWNVMFFECVYYETFWNKQYLYDFLYVSNNLREDVLYHE